MCLIFLPFLQMPRKFVNDADYFCYICDKTTLASQKCSITAPVNKSYFLYFGCKIGDQNNSWFPHICCNTCATNLRQWLSRKRKCMPFAVPMVWREPTKHNSNYYFCVTPQVGKGLSRKKKQNIQYPGIPSAICLVPHGETLPVPEAPQKFTLDSDNEQSVSSTSSS